MLNVDFPKFRPAPTLTFGHFQTLGAFLFPGDRPAYSAVKHIVDLYDGDRLVVHDDKPEHWHSGDRIAILFHGLCGHHLSPYVVRAANKLNQNGVRTFRVDLRGFGDSTLVSKSHLHGGNFGDAQSVVKFVNRISPQSQISLIGYSIGGNIVLKTLGQWGSDTPNHVDSAVAICPPIDLVHASSNLRRFDNRIYEKYFIRQLKSQLETRRKLVRGLVDNQLDPLPKQLYHWDDQFTAPCWGYAGASDYYENASSCQDLKDISVPTIILAAKDDPVVPHSMFSEHELSGHIRMISTKKGGHLGFIGGRSEDPDRYWMDWRICQWVLSAEEHFATTQPHSESILQGAPFRPQPAQA